MTSVSICFRLGSSAIQVYTNRTGGMTSRNLPLTMWIFPLGDSTPIRNPPPTLRSISATVRMKFFPTLHHFFSSLGSVQARKVLWRVAGKTREIRRESCDPSTSLIRSSRPSPRSSGNRQAHRVVPSRASCTLLSISRARSAESRRGRTCTSCRPSRA